jgi:signal transduction histidine kinase
MHEELSLHILDIGMNSLAAGATSLAIRVSEDPARDRLGLLVRDNGRGMDRAALARALSGRGSTKAGRPRAIGLGLAFLRQAADACEGRFRAASLPGRGTAIAARMRLSHVDRPPLGDLAATVRALVAAAPRARVRVECRCAGETFSFDSQTDLQPPEHA